MEEQSIIKQIKIVRIVEETSEAKTFWLQAIDWEPDYSAGQFITLVFRTAHGEKRRSYSFSSLPEEGMSITVKRVENGEFSRYMLEHLRVGDILYSSGIAGLFQLPPDISPEAQFCFLAAGSGIVPCYPLIKTLLLRTDRRVLLIYSNRTEATTLFYASLQLLQTEFPGRFVIKYLFSVKADVYEKRLSKWLLEQFLAQYLPQDLKDTWFYLCGPFEYMQTIEITLRIYAPKEHIRKENFSSLPRIVLPEPPDKSPHQVSIRLGERNHTFMVRYPKSILKTAREHQIELPYSCEAGRCSSCVATCSSGKVWMAYNEVLSDREVAAGRILVCQAFPVEGDVEIIYENG